MSLYLKYRPSDFTNLVWQSFVKETLQKAIENKKTVWAYLFCGPRWTWKTSTARLFAKTVNCENSKKWNPCLKCSICLDFADEKLIDIIEIDAASYTWVDNIRAIIERAQFSPTKTKYKIYIVDEVHMLSKWAFNALLKILEEPPKHVKFILATTETHKVPETIISRCQRYDFKRISDTDINDRLLHIAKEEKIKTDEKSINYIVKHSSGWLRNAISLFEQLIFDWELNYEKIVEKLEIVDDDTLKIFLKKLLSKDNSVLEILDKNTSDWKNIKLFFKELLFFTKNSALELIKKWEDISDYITILDTLDDAYSKTKNSLDENITFLVWVLKILNWYNPENNIIEASNIQKSKPEVKNIEKITTAKQTENTTSNKVEKKEISNEDLDDVFWDNEKIATQHLDTNVTSSSAFDVKSFVNKLKENWAAWSLTFSIRWDKTTLHMKDNNLHIWTNDWAAKNQLKKSDNLVLMLKALTDMGITNPDIKIN